MGGKREGAGRHKRGCECGKCKSKAEAQGSRPTDANLARKIKAKVKAEELWVKLIETEVHRLCLDKPVKERPNNASITPLANILRYLDDRDLGRPMDTVNHLHDKPIQVEATLKISEIVREVRERKEKYERSKHS